MPLVEERHSFTQRSDQQGGCRDTKGGNAREAYGVKTPALEARGSAPRASVFALQPLSFRVHLPWQKSGENSNPPLANQRSLGAEP